MNVSTRFVNEIGPFLSVYNIVAYPVDVFGSKPAACSILFLDSIVSCDGYSQ